MADIADKNNQAESLGSFLRFLLLEHGARPDGSPERPGRPWGQKEFADAVGVSPRALKYWLDDEKSPGDPLTIERVLFGKKADYDDWRLRLRRAWQTPNTPGKASASTADKNGATPPQRSPTQILHPEIRPVAGFTGRDNQLAAIDAALWQGGGSAALTNAAAIHGLGGVGKTVLARMYGWRNRARYRGVWWLRAETQDEADQTLIDDLLALGSELQIPRFDEIRERDQSRAIQLTLAAIEQSGAETPWLMIYDNAEKPNAIEKLTPRSGAHLLITTRWPHWHGRAEPLAVDVFPPEIAIDYLLDGAPFPDREAAARLAEALGYLPLALSHARAYCIESHLDFDAYGARIAERIKHAPGSADYPDTVFATFNLAMDKVAANCAEAEKLVAAIAFLAPDQIPVSLFTEDFIEEALLNKAVAALSNISLITHETLEDGARGFSVHRLVQSVMRARLENREQDARQSALSLMHNALSTLSVQEHSDWPQVALLLPHALAVADATPESQRSSGKAAEHSALIYDRIATYLQSRGSYAAAEPHFARALAIREAALGPDHPSTANSLNNFALLHRDRGAYDAAAPLYKRALAIREAALGPDHPDTAATLNNLALLHSDQGAYDEAEPLYARALAIHEAALGPDHPLIALSLNNLANLHSDRSEHDEAESLYTRALAIREAALGPDHPYTAATLNNLASLHYDRGEYDQAAPLCARALAIYEAALGPEHPDTANSLNSLAVLHHDRGEHDAAAPLLARALAIREAALGPEHPRTQTTRRNCERLKADRADQESADPSA
ncbi:MAG: tetratricopeptide repeat protein [Rhodomicrobiaceae bacterium]